MSLLFECLAFMVFGVAAGMDGLDLKRPMYWILLILFFVFFNLAKYYN